MIFKMKQAVVISILVVSLVSFAYTAEETDNKETGKSYGLTDTGKGTIVAILIGVGFLALGGSTLLDGSRRNSQYVPSYQKDVSNLQLNNQIQKGIANYHYPLASSSITTPTQRREKRAAPIGLTYRRDGTISLRCRYSPQTCRKVTRRRNRRGGKRLFSLYLKPAAADGSSLNNLSKKFNGGLRGRGAPPRVRNQQQAKGKRIFSIRLKSPQEARPKQIRPVQSSVGQSIYGRAFQRFTDDVTLSKQRAKYYKNYVGGLNRRISHPRGRRAPPRQAPARQRGQKRQAPKGKGREIFSLFLKPPAPKIQYDNLQGPITGLLRPRGKPGQKADIPLICRFQPKKCGRKGHKIFSIYYKGFKNVFPKAFPLL